MLRILNDTSRFQIDKSKKDIIAIISDKVSNPLKELLKKEFIGNLICNI